MFYKRLILKGVFIKFHFSIGDSAEIKRVLVYEQGHLESESKHKNPFY
jgi:hypothetical protein